MANNPDILLCDEPTGELDSESKLMIMNTLRFIIKQYPTKSIIIVTHDPEMKTIADRLYLIRDGVISQETSKDDLLDFQGQKNDFALENLPKRLNLTQMRKLNQVLSQTIKKIEKYKHIYMNDEEP
jgi:ABC-type multidrug transport system ATPase subunit